MAEKKDTEATSEIVSKGEMFLAGCLVAWTLSFGGLTILIGFVVARCCP